LLERDQLGHWEFSRKLDPDKHFGFLYCITSLEESRFYLGRKNFSTGGKKTKKHPKTGKRVVNTAYGKDTKWRSYRGSSVDLTKAITTYGEDKFHFEMIDVYNTYGGLYYAEAFLQMSTETMTRKVPGNDSCFLFYNRQIAAVRFRPKEEPTRKTRQFIDKLNKENKL